MNFGVVHSVTGINKMISCNFCSRLKILRFYGLTHYTYTTFGIYRVRVKFTSNSDQLFQRCKESYGNINLGNPSHPPCSHLMIPS